MGIPAPRKIDSSIVQNPPPNVAVPDYNRERLTQGIVHLGVGGFHRSHQALYLDELMRDHGLTDWAICGVGIMPQDEAMQRGLSAQNCLYTLVERSGKEDTARIIGSITSYIFARQEPEAAFKKLADPTTRIVSITATEAAYYMNPESGDLDLGQSAVQHDLKEPLKPQTIFGYLAEGLDRRRKAGTEPFSVLSCDNLQGNGHAAHKTLITFCKARSPELAKWVYENVTFPNCMVDRITPMTTDSERELVRSSFGLDDAVPVVSESFRQWVIEENFCNGRPPWEKVGVQFTKDVVPYETVKIRLLNATHSAMVYLGYLCGYRYVHEVAQNPELGGYLRRMMDDEVTPLLGTVPGINLTEYKRQVMERFANSTTRDQVLRICMDGSAKFPKFIFPQILEQLAVNGPITLLTFSVAGWIRFLSGVDEQGNEIPISDPMGEQLRAAARSGKEDPTRILAFKDVFGELSESPRFTKELRHQLGAIYEKGAKKALVDVVS